MIMQNQDGYPSNSDSAASDYEGRILILHNQNDDAAES